jgi:MoxR-like ATPase
VAAYCNGRSSVSEFDCLLLQHILWQRPAEADRIYDWLLGQLAVDDGIKQAMHGAGPGLLHLQNFPGRLMTCSA